MRLTINNSKMLPIKLILVLVLESVVGALAARILAYYPGPSISHQVVFRPITLDLIKRGHQVTVITTDPMFTKDNRPANLTEIDVHDVSYDMVKYFAPFVTGKQSDVLNQAKFTMDFQLLLIEEQFKVREVKDLLQYRKDEFDLLLLEAFISTTLGLTYTFSAPVILVSSFGAFPGNYETVGAPRHPILYHNSFRQRLYNLTLWEKLTEAFNHVRIQRIISNNEEKENELLRKVFGPDIPPINILKNNIDMLFLNTNPIWEGNCPVPPGVIHMGGLHQKQPKELPKDLQNYLDESKNGVIYFSFGTNVKPSLLPPAKIAIFERVFSQIPYNVIWKWDNENFSVAAKNIKMFKWLPQADLLRHRNVKVFITQGGLQSTDEAITAGVPLIGIPMLGDQWYNVKKYVHHKIGVRLDLEDLTEDRLRTAILEVAESESYRNNIIFTAVTDQPQKPLERAIWWIEYVLRHGGAKHLRAPAANMSWSEFLELELLGVLILGTLASLASVALAVKFLIFPVLRRNQLAEKLKTS